jgi:hypothetical protein
MMETDIHEFWFRMRDQSREILLDESIMHFQSVRNHHEFVCKLIDNLAYIDDLKDHDKAKFSHFIIHQKAITINKDNVHYAFLFHIIRTGNEIKYYFYLKRYELNFEHALCSSITLHIEV